MSTKEVSRFSKSFINVLKRQEESDEDEGLILVSTNNIWELIRMYPMATQDSKVDFGEVFSTEEKTNERFR
jgi:hypothetical protein